MNKRTRMMLMNYGKDRDHEYTEDKFRDRRGREHYDNGRYAPRSEYEGYMESHYYPAPYVPPLYENGYKDGKPTNKIGFAMEGEINPDYRSDSTYHRMHEMDNMHGKEMTRGAYGGHKMQFNREMAEHWTQGMKNADGTTGAHWNMEQAKQVMAQRGIDEDPVAFWVALNAMYSDYMPVAKELGMNTVDFYSKMAKAFIDDMDAYPDKMARYYQYVVKH